MSGSPLRYNLEDLRITNLDKFRLLFAIVTLAYIVTILTAFDERKNSLLRKNAIKIELLMMLFQYLNRGS